METKTKVDYLSSGTLKAKTRNSELVLPQNNIYLFCLRKEPQTECYLIYGTPSPRISSREQ